VTVLLLTDVHAKRRHRHDSQYWEPSIPRRSHPGSADGPGAKLEQARGNYLSLWEDLHLDVQKCAIAQSVKRGVPHARPRARLAGGTTTGASGSVRQSARRILPSSSGPGAAGNLAVGSLLCRLARATTTARQEPSGVSVRAGTITSRATFGSIQDIAGVPLPISTGQACRSVVAGARLP
jgi:hypothetical protein